MYVADSSEAERKKRKKIDVQQDQEVLTDYSMLAWSPPARRLRSKQRRALILDAAVAVTSKKKNRRTKK